VSKLSQPFFTYTKVATEAVGKRDAVDIYGALATNVSDMAGISRFDGGIGDALTIDRGGILQINVGEAVAIGDPLTLESGGTDGTFIKSITATNNIIGYALEASAGAGQIQAEIWMSPFRIAIA
jgi:hypothetical protein